MRREEQERELQSKFFFGSKKGSEEEQEEGLGHAGGNGYRRHESDLTDEEWRQIKEWLPHKKRRGGRPRSSSLRRVVDAILYFEKERCPWRKLPGEFPEWQAVYSRYRAWKKDGTWARMMTLLHKEKNDSN